MTTTSRLSLPLLRPSGLRESLGSGGAREGKIRKSLAEFEVSWKTGIVYSLGNYLWRSLKLLKVGLVVIINMNSELFQAIR
jgi:hypothetical protein